jgi:hypothetical protein
LLRSFNRKTLCKIDLGAAEVLGRGSCGGGYTVEALGVYVAEACAVGDFFLFDRPESGENPPNLLCAKIIHQRFQYHSNLFLFELLWP